MNENTPKVEIELDKKRYMTFTFRVAKKFKEETGKSITALSEGLDFEDISTLLWLTLLSDDPELTQDDADELFNILHLDVYTEKLTALVNKSHSKADGESPKAKSPTGS